MQQQRHGIRRRTAGRRIVLALLIAVLLVGWLAVAHGMECPDPLLDHSAAHNDSSATMPGHSATDVALTVEQSVAAVLDSARTVPLQELALSCVVLLIALAAIAVTMPARFGSLASRRPVMHQVCRPFQRRAALSIQQLGISRT